MIQQWIYNAVSGDLSSPHESRTRLHGRALALARAAWLAIVALAALLFVVAIPARAQFLFTACELALCIPGQLSADGVSALHQLGLSREFYATYLLLGETAFPLIFAAVGAFIFWRKANDWIALFVSVALILLGTTIGANFDALAQTDAVWRALVAIVRAFGMASLLLLFVFPNGRLAPHWTRPLVLLLMAMAALLPFSPFAYPSLPALLVLVAWLIVGAAVQVYRYHFVYTPLEQQQTKWVIFGFAVAMIGFIVAFVLPPVLAPEQISPPNGAVHSVLGLFYVMVAIPLAFAPALLIPLSLAFSIMRYRLWDIDLIIRRTLIYSALTLALALVYFVSVIVLQAAARTLTSQQQSEAVTVVSTLGIAALFVPLRNRIQHAIDRRFYRRKYDAAKTLQDFAATLRDEVDLPRLSERLLDVVDATMQPAHTSLWLMDTQQHRNTFRNE